MRAAQAARGIIQWVDIVGFFIRSDFGQRYKRSSFSVFFTMFEPVMLIAIMFITRWIATGLLDWNAAVFHTSGLIPFYFFMHVSFRMRLADMVAPVPGVSWFDRAFALVISEALSKVIVGVILMLIFYQLGAWTAYPRNLVGCMAPTFWLMVCGVGVGLFNTAIGRFAPGYLYAYAILMRVLLLTSGIVTRPDTIPTNARWLTDWNPLFHGITWFRAEYFYGYPTYMLDKSFLIYFALGSAFFGGLLHANTKQAR